MVLDGDPPAPHRSAFTTMTIARKASAASARRMLAPGALPAPTTATRVTKSPFRGGGMGRRSRSAAEAGAFGAPGPLFFRTDATDRVRALGDLRICVVVNCVTM